MFLKHVGRHFQGGKKILIQSVSMATNVELYKHLGWFWRLIQGEGAPDGTERGVWTRKVQACWDCGPLCMFSIQMLTRCKSKTQQEKKKKQKLRDHFPKYICIPLVSILIRKRMLEYNQSLSVFQVWKDITLLPLPLPQSIPWIKQFLYEHIQMHMHVHTHVCVHTGMRTRMYTHMHVHVATKLSHLHFFYFYIYSVVKGSMNYFSFNPWTDCKG